jgi:hypothetical protein
MVDQQGGAEFSGASSQRADAKLVRGPGSWAAIWGAFGFAVAIEGTLIQLAAPQDLKWPCSAGLNVGLYTLFGGLTFWLFYCPWFQDIVLRAKQRFERPIP